MNGKVTISAEIYWYYATTIAGIMAALNEDDSSGELGPDGRDALIEGIDELIVTADDILDDYGHERLRARLAARLNALT